MTASVGLRRKVFVLGLALLAGMGFMLAASPSAWAFHCYVEDKPNGAGSVGLDDFKEAGDSGNLVAPGAFIDTSVTGASNDIFIRGVPAEAPIDFAGSGSLPAEAHDNGTEDHGVNSF